MKSGVVFKLLFKSLLLPGQRWNGFPFMFIAKDWLPVIWNGIFFLAITSEFGEGMNMVEKKKKITFLQSSLRNLYWTKVYFYFFSGTGTGVIMIFVWLALWTKVVKHYNTHSPSSIEKHKRALGTMQANKPK